MRYFQSNFLYVLPSVTDIVNNRFSLICMASCILHIKSFEKSNRRTQQRVYSFPFQRKNTSFAFILGGKRFFFLFFFFISSRINKFFYFLYFLLLLLFLSPFFVLLINQSIILYVAKRFLFFFLFILLLSFDFFTFTYSHERKSYF